MTQLDNAASINFSTAFSTDKVVGILRDSYAASTGTLVGGYLYKKAIPHSFTRPVFCEISWSTDGTNYFDGGSSDGISAQSAIAYSDSSNIYILAASNVGTLYYKIVATWIDDYDATNPSIVPVLNTTNKLYFDSRVNLPKVISTGRLVLNGGGTTNIIHTLGYLPRFKAYTETLPGEIWPMLSGGSSNPWLYDPANQLECSALITTALIEVTYSGPASNRNFWYRMYADQ